MGKILLIASIALTAIAACLSFMTHNKLATATQAIVDAQAKTQLVQGDLAKTKSELSKDKDQLATLQSASEQNAQALQAAQNELTSTKSQIADLTKQSADATTQLTAANGKIADLTAQLAAPKPSATPSTSDADFQAQIAEQKARADKLQTDLDATRTDLATYKKKEQARMVGEMASGVEGRILAVNSAYNFVVLSLGDRSGVANNTELLIKRGTQFVGRVRVTSVSPSTSIADIVANSVPQGYVVQAGDNVIYQKAPTDAPQQ